jgi:hypothetical protein
MTLPLKRLRFGALDARYEIITRDRNHIEHFRESFLSPSGISIEEFMRGIRFFVYGTKGAGKTAFLRYLKLKAEEDQCLTKFTSFSVAISDQGREKIFLDAGIRIYEQKDVEPTGSAVNMWVIFIFRQIADLIEDNKVAFTSNHQTRLFCEMLKRFHKEESKSMLTWLSNAIKTGKYKLKAKYFEANLTGKAAESEQEYAVDLVVRQGFNLLRSLSWEGLKRIYIFFDELNLSFGNRDQHRRDAILIRDLILAIDQLNNFFIEQEKPIFVLAAARSEVLNALNIPTEEIRRVLTDRGRELRWFGLTGGDRWPILDLVTKKIQASEKLANSEPSDDVFVNYFQRGIFGMSPQSFIVELTWCNPRDLVLLLGNAAEKAGNEPRFGERVLIGVLDQFSEAAWSDKADELNVEYAMVEIHSIKKILLNFNRYFKADQFEKEAVRKGGLDQNVRTLIAKRRVTKVLEDLYRVGIIGQSSKEPTNTGSGLTQLREHWAYRGDESFDPTAWMIVHRAFWPELRLGRIHAQAESVAKQAIGRPRRISPRK